MSVSQMGAGLDRARVLIIGGHAITRLGLRFLLAADPRYHILGHLDHGALVSFFVASQPIDLVLLDFCLPDIDGIQVLADLIGRYDMTVVVLTGAATSAEAKHALKLGARAVLSTSDGEEEILAACDAALAGEVYLSCSIKNELAGVSRDPRSLLPRQMAILHYLAQGIARQEIGRRLGISAPTLSFHIAELMRTFNVSDARVMIERARKLDFLRPETMEGADTSSREGA